MQVCVCMRAHTYAQPRTHKNYGAEWGFVCMYVNQILLLRVHIHTRMYMRNLLGYIAHGLHFRDVGMYLCMYTYSPGWTLVLFPLDRDRDRDRGYVFMYVYLLSGLNPSPISDNCTPSWWDIHSHIIALYVYVHICMYVCMYVCMNAYNVCLTPISDNHTPSWWDIHSHIIALHVYVCVYIYIYIYMYECI
jgi:hypothetical protein